jgi:hypothetical protein
LPDGSLMPDGCTRLLCITGNKSSVRAAANLATEIMQTAPNFNAANFRAPTLTIPQHSKPPALPVSGHPPPKPAAAASVVPAAAAAISSSSSSNRSNPDGTLAAAPNAGTFCYGTLPPVRAGTKDVVTRRLECPRTHVKLLLGKRGRTMQRLLNEMGPVQVCTTTLQQYTACSCCQ